MRIFQKRNKWWVDYREPDGTRRRKPVGKSKREAQAALEKIKSAILCGNYYQDHVEVEKRKGGELTLGQLWNEFESARIGVSESTKAREKIAAEKILLPFFGRETSLAAMTPAHVSQFVKWRENKGIAIERGCSKATVARDLSVLRSMWGWGEEFLPGGVPRSPIPKNKRLRLPNQSPGRIDFFNRAELNQIIAGARSSSPTRLLPAVALGAYAGLRRGEITQLRWQCVDFENGMVQVRNYSTKDGRRYRTKSAKDRSIPLRAELVEILRNLQTSLLERGSLPELVVPANLRGEPCQTFIGAWRRLLKGCGIRYLPIHSLRHTFASHLIMAGVSLVSVKMLLGHTSTIMAERYTHVVPEHLSEEMNRVVKWHQEGTRPSKTQRKAGRPSS